MFSMVKKDEILSFMKEKEGPKLEHKSKEYLSKKPKEIAKGIASFANAEGGKILIGVRDGKANGLIFKQEDEERIMQICAGHMNPIPRINFEMCEFEKGTIYVLEILPSREPVEVDRKYPIRQGSITRDMTREELKKKFAEAEKIFKLMDSEEAYRTLSDEQKMRDIILSDRNKKSAYLEFYTTNKSISTIYSTHYHFFDENSYFVQTTLHGVTIDELTKILAKYYKIFGIYSLSNSAFSVRQHGFNWVGYGPINFIETIKDQKTRYNRIRQKYGKDVHIHHRETAFYMDEIRDGLFYLQAQPNSLNKVKKITLDYCDIGFAVNNIPFSSLFQEFFRTIGEEPFTIFDNRTGTIITKNYRKFCIPFKPSGLIDSRFKDRHHRWISGLYGKIPLKLQDFGLDSEIIVNLHQHHWAEDIVNYYIYQIRYTKFDLGFPAAIVGLIADWEEAQKTYTAQ